MSEKKVTMRYHTSEEYDRITRRIASGSKCSIYPLREMSANGREGCTCPLREMSTNDIGGSTYPLQEMSAKEREKLSTRRKSDRRLRAYQY